MDNVTASSARGKSRRTQKPPQSDYTRNTHRLGRAITHVIREAERIGDRTTVLVALALRQAIADR